MTNHELAIGQAIQKGDEYYRILWLDRDQCFWIRLEPSSNVPQRISRSDLEKGLASGEYVFAMFQSFKRPGFKDEAKANARRDRIWELIRPAVEREPEIYDKHARTKILKELETASGVKVNNIYGYLGKYWRAGKIPDALLPDYSNVGKTHDPYNETSAKAGAKPRDGAAGKKLTHADLANFEEVYEEYYVKQGCTLLQTYQNMLDRHYSSKDHPEGMPADQVPSRGQFYYWHRHTKDKMEEAAEEKGESKYNLENRGGTGRTETYLYGPCALAQIDATIADMYLVRQDMRSQIVGRPTVYFVLDAFSHMVTGVHISLKPPSWEAAGMALYNSCEDKTAFCAQYGYSITPDLWPCMHIPSAIVGDRGEMEGYGPEKLAKDLGIRISNTPPFRGDLKGIVESHFHILNYWVGTIPGHVEKDFGERCTQDYRLDAILDIRQFTEIVIRCILHHNNTHYMKTYPVTFLMRQNQILPIPREIWNFGMAYLSGAHRVLSHAVICGALLPHGTGSITRSGICFNGLYYTCERANKEKWFDRARTEGREKIDVVYDPRNAALINIQYGGEKEYTECHLVEYLGEMVGVSQEEVNVINEHASAQAKVYEYTEDREASHLNAAIEAIIADAEKAAKDLPKQSKAERLRNIPENREAEIEAQVEAATKATLHELKGVTSASEAREKTADAKEVDAVEQMLRNVFEEMENK